METPPAVFGEFGRTLAFAERALTAVLREHLALRGVVPETWFALRLLGTSGSSGSSGSGLSRQALIEALDGSRNLDSGSGAEVVARLEAEGLIRGAELTAEGDAFYRDLREYVTAPTVRLLSQFDINDIETTVKTLRAIADNAA